MNDKVTEQLAATAGRLAAAAESLDRVLARLDSQQAALNAKVDRIVAAVEEDEAEVTNEASGEGKKPEQELLNRVAELEKANEDLRAQATRMTRKTLSPLVTTLLSKSSGETSLDAGVLDKTLETLSVEQRIAVKAEMARAGMIE